jgi:hypothetical protein
MGEMTITLFWRGEGRKTINLSEDSQASPGPPSDKRQYESTDVRMAEGSGLIRQPLNFDFLS